MNLNEYQELAMTYRSPSADHQYALLNLAGEVGEVCSLVAKLIRDGGNVDDFYNNMKKELGDVLWQLSAVAADNGFDLEAIATANLAKLESRKQRNTLGGSGNDR